MTKEGSGIPGPDDITKMTNQISKMKGDMYVKDKNSPTGRKHASVVRGAAGIKPTSLFETKDP
jgi:hypothetical protein